MPEQSGGKTAPAAPALRRGAPSPKATVFCFTVDAMAEPGVMPRVLEVFARRSLVPTKWYSRAGHAGDLQIDIQVAALEPASGDYIASCLRQLVGVHSVLTSLAAG